MAMTARAVSRRRRGCGERAARSLRVVSAAHYGERVRPAWGVLYTALLLVGALGTLAVEWASTVGWEDATAGLAGGVAIIVLAAWVRSNRAALASRGLDVPSDQRAEAPRIVRSRRPLIVVGPHSAEDAPRELDDRVVVPDDFR